MKTLENVVVLSLEDYEQLMKNQKTEELEVGKWYKWRDDFTQIVFKKDKSGGYGIWNNIQGDSLVCNISTNWEKASPIEVYEALKKHAISLGFEGDFSFSESIPNGFKCDGVIIFNNGVWEKPKAKIDYDRLKTGSVVMLKHTGQHCAGITYFDLNKPATILLYKANGIYLNGEYKLTERPYTTFIQGQNTSHFTTYDEDYITEVISY